jgi:hypothetical protein
MNTFKNFWHIWSKSLGEKASNCDKTSDKVAMIRTFMFATYLITNCFIIANTIRHWNDKTTVQVVIDSSTLPDYQTPEPRKSNKSFEFE